MHTMTISALKLQVFAERNIHLYYYYFFFLILYLFFAYFRDLMHKNDAFSRSARKKSLHQHYSLYIILYDLQVVCKYLPLTWRSEIFTVTSFHSKSAFLWKTFFSVRDNIKYIYTFFTCDLFSIGLRAITTALFKQTQFVRIMRTKLDG